MLVTRGYATPATPKKKREDPKKMKKNEKKKKKNTPPFTPPSGSPLLDPRTPAAPPPFGCKPSAIQIKNLSCLPPSNQGSSWKLLFESSFSNLIYKKPFMPHTWELLFESSHPQIRAVGNCCLSLPEPF
jgi:hypothetical protein